MTLASVRDQLGHGEYADREETSRAARYEIRVPVMYRPLEGGDWLEGWSRDISPSGMLLHVEERLRIGAKIELAFTIALNRRTNFATRVMGTGEVVRIITEGSQPGHVMGIRILEYNLARMSERPPEHSKSSQS